MGDHLRKYLKHLMKDQRIMEKDRIVERDPDTLVGKQQGWSQMIGGPGLPKSSSDNAIEGVVMGAGTGVRRGMRRPKKGKQSRTSKKSRKSKRKKHPKMHPSLSLLKTHGQQCKSEEKKR